MKNLFLFFLLACACTANAQQLVMPGDHPDPSVVKIGDTYWASATSSNWMPVFPLMRSNNLKDWKTTGHIFQQPPEWADYYFWAPEMTYENGKVYVYYTAHKKGGNLCVGVASADRPEGPYRDHGPIICQAAGSIDAFPMRDKAGKLYLIWKEDGNSVRQPTPIWIQEMNEERTALLGEKKELFRNTESWEANLVEGVSIIRQGDYFYALYAAAGCCGPGCTYATGVARAKDLLGPWEKYSGNPILTHNDQWRCPGHGTTVEKDGKYYFLYHGYNAQSTVFTGREGLLQEFRFTPDGWIEFVKAPGTINRDVAPRTDRFRGGKLPNYWEWNVFQKPDFSVAGGALKLSGGAGPTGHFTGQKTLSGNYTATAVVRPRKSTAGAGIAILGDEQNTLTLYLDGTNLRLTGVQGGRDTTWASVPVTAGRKLRLRVSAQGGNQFLFSYSTKGNDYVPVNATPVNGSYLPPWDRALRVGLAAKGAAGTVAVFDHFEVDPQ
jgi:xylan 1,4-beta-xylosidase